MGCCRPCFRGRRGEIPIFRIYTVDSAGALTLRRELLNATKVEALAITSQMQRASPNVQTWFLDCEPDTPQRLN